MAATSSSTDGTRCTVDVLDLVSLRQALSDVVARAIGASTSEISRPMAGLRYREPTMVDILPALVKNLRARKSATWQSLQEENRND